MRRSRKGQKNIYERSRSSNPMLNILFVALIVLLLCVIAVAGVIIFKNSNMIGSPVDGIIGQSYTAEQPDTTEPISQPDINEPSDPIEPPVAQPNPDEQPPEIPLEETQAQEGDNQTDTESDNNAQMSDISYFDDAVFFGDSISTGLELFDILKDSTVIAVTGANPQNVFTQKKITVNANKVTMYDALLEKSPNKVYVLLGANWLGGVQIENVVKYYREMIEKMKTDLPNATIYIQSVFPVSKKYENNTKTGISNELIAEFNGYIEQIAKDNNLIYLDVSKKLKDDTGYLPEEATDDGMHLRSAYYKEWIDFLRSNTKEILDKQI